MSWRAEALATIGCVTNPLVASARLAEVGNISLPPVEYVAVDPVVIDGVELHLPHALPGLTGYVGAARAEAQANELRPHLLEGLDTKGHVPYQPDATLVFDFLGAGGAVATSAIAGLEAFANHHVTRYCPPAQYDDRWKIVGTEPTVKVGVEDHTFKTLADLPLNERYAQVLPELMKRPSPTNAAWWPTFRRLQGLAALLRHGITDPVKRKGLDGKKTLVQRLCDREYAGAARMMLDAFEHVSPGWLGPERLGQLPPPPEP